MKNRLMSVTLAMFMLMTFVSHGYEIVHANTVSDWTPVSSVPEGAEIVDRKYIYTLTTYTTSSSSSLSGWINDGTWVWSDYGGWSDWIDGSASGSEYRKVENRHVYRYHNFTCSNPNCSRHQVPYYGTCLACGSPVYENSWWETWDTTPYSKWWNEGKADTNWWGHIGKPYTSWLNGTYTWWESDEGWQKDQYRYCERSKVYTYYKTETKESATDPTGEQNVSDIREYVKYKLSDSPSEKASVNIGEYVQMGTYYDAPILWRCVDIDENGPLMLSDKIICLKSFDAAGDDSNGSHRRSESRSQNGSNYWADSNMRSWLNSTATAGNVNWLCGNPPSEDYVWNGYNDYAGEAGFLTNFSAGELGAIKEITQKSLVAYPESDNGVYTDGTEQHKYDTNIAGVVTNYDSAYAEYVTDKMFLMDIKQVNAVYNNRDILGADYYIGEPTEQAVTNSEYTAENLSGNKKWYYWLRSPDACIYPHRMRYIYSDGYVHNHDACYGSHGVRPAFYLDLSSACCKDGGGTESDPYIITGSEPTSTAAPIRSGVDGSITWTYDGITLTITGSDAIPDHSDNPPEWSELANTVKKIVIGDGISTIGAGAFKDMNKAVSIEIPNSVRTIGDNVFENCTALKDQKLPSSLTGIGENAFKCCTAIETIEVPQDVKSIGYGAFEGCVKLKEITVPYVGPSCTNTENTFGYIFNDNVPDALKKVTVTNAQTIPQNAFAGLDNLEEIAVNTGVTSIGSGAFDGCKALKTFTIPASVTAIADNTFRGCDNVVTITVPDTVTSIGSGAFDGCKSLLSVNIPHGIKELNDNTFRGCESISGIEIPTTATHIGKSVLEGCISLRSIKVPFVGANMDTAKTEETSDDIVGYLFGTDDNSKIPPSVTRVEITSTNRQSYIPKGAFANCGNIRDIIIDGGRNILEGAFENCKLLTNLYIPDSMSTIGFQTPILKGCTKLETLTIPFVGTDRNDKNTETSVLGALFGFDDKDITGTLQYYNTNGDSHYYKVPKTLRHVSLLCQTDIPAGAFSECDFIEKISIVTGASMGDRAFYHCASLKSITLPNDLKDMGIRSFAECENLENINIPTKVRSIGDQSFYNCRALKNVTMPDSVTEIAGDIFNGTNLLSADYINLLAANKGTITCSRDSAAYEYALAHHIATNVVDASKLDIKRTSTTVTLLSDNTYLFDVTDSYNLRGELHIEMYNDTSNKIGEKIIDADKVEYRINFKKNEMANVSYVNIYVSDENGNPVSTEAEVLSVDNGTIPEIPESDITLNYLNGAVTLNGTVNIEFGTMLIEAIYNGNTLDKVITYPVHFNNETINVEDFEGKRVKFMLWNNIAEMQSLANTIER